MLVEDCNVIVQYVLFFIPQSYSEISTNPDDYEGQSVLIIGRGATEIKMSFEKFCLSIIALLPFYSAATLTGVT